MTEHTYSMRSIAEAKEIVTDDEVKLYHRGDFGPLTPRQVLNEAVVKVAFGYSTGSTAMMILRDHRLITRPSEIRFSSQLTAKGKKYLRAIFPVLPKPHKDFDA
jgi:hypothetical protein